MSPALEAATATIVPTVSTAAPRRRLGPAAAAKTEATPSSVTRVIPEMGCEETPTIPTIRAATVTKRMPKTPTPAAHTARCRRSISPAKTPGTRAATDDHEHDAAKDEAAGQVAIGPVRHRPRRLRGEPGAARPSQAAGDGQEGAGHGRQRRAAP